MTSIKTLTTALAATAAVLVSASSASAGYWATRCTPPSPYNPSYCWSEYVQTCHSFWVSDYYGNRLVTQCN